MMNFIQRPRRPGLAELSLTYRIVPNCHISEILLIKFLFPDPWIDEAQKIPEFIEK